MKTLIATALFLVSSAAAAHDVAISHDSCAVELNGGVRISSSEIEFSKNKKTLYKIIDNEILIVAGDEINLTNTERALISDYSTSIRTLVPEIKFIALDGIALATDGVNLAFNELLGEGNDIGSEITEHLTDIRNEVDQRFALDKEIYIDENGFEGEDFFGEEFEQRVELAVEETLKKSMGSLMMAIGQEMLFSGGDMNAFETRMENFGDQIESEIQSRSSELEKRADRLCQSIVNIDQLEEQLKTAIDELESFDLLITKNDNKLAASLK